MPSPTVHGGNATDLSLGPDHAQNVREQLEQSIGGVAKGLAHSLPSSFDFDRNGGPRVWTGSAMAHPFNAGAGNESLAGGQSGQSTASPTVPGGQNAITLDVSGILALRAAQPIGTSPAQPASLQTTGFLVLDGTEFRFSTLVPLNG